MSTALNLMFSKCSILRPTATHDSSGGEVQSWTTVYTDIGVNIQPYSSRWGIDYASAGLQVSHSLFFGTDPTVKNGDKITSGTRTYLVVGIHDLIDLKRIKRIDVLQLL